MHFAIFDDDRLICKELEDKLNRLANNEDIVESFSEFNTVILDDNGFDIVFMDIKLGDKNGIQIVKRLKKVNPLTKTIFISSYTKYAQDIFEVDPIYFLEKPIDDKKLEEAFQKAVKQIKSDKEEYILFKNKEQLAKVLVCEINYIESKGRLIIIHLDKKSIITYDKLDNIQRKLPEFFCRSHKSYLLNLKKVKLLGKSFFTMSNDELVPISQSKYKESKNKFIKLVGDSN